MAEAERTTPNGTVRSNDSVETEHDTEPQLAPGETPSRRRITGRALLAVIAVAVLAAVALASFSIGRISALGITPNATSAEAGFARDMQAHHIQGVEMAMMIRDRSDDPAVRTLAFDIATTQGQQSGQLYGWLHEWGLNQYGPEPSMTWMTRPGLDGSAHAHDGDGSASAHVPGEPMPGLATPAQIAQLDAATGLEAERLFLTLMIAHHQGAAEMAQAVLDRSTNDVIVGFANAVVESQLAEIKLMERLLAERS